MANFLRTAPATKGVSRRDVVRCALAAAAYLVAASAACFAQYQSEVRKIARGTFSDTVGPYAWSNVYSLPSSLLARSWPGYPDAFDARTFLRAADDYFWSAYWPILLDTALVFVVLLALTRIRVRARK